MKKKSNEYGFTLVELLVTIAIMLSITVLAIVNIVGVSNRKKEEAWVSVKEEIETAASDYFKYNEYLFEGLGGTGTGTISVGSLVSDDYINKVTDPRTGKALSYCTKVNVTKTNRGITTEIDDDTISSSDNPEDCKDTYSVTVSNAKNAPKISVKDNCEVSKDAADPTWCSNKKGNVTITATVKETNDSSIKSFAAISPVNIDIDDHNTTTKEIKCYINKQTSSSSVKFVAESVDGGKTETVINKLKWDKTGPFGTLEIKSSKNGYKSNNVYFSLDAKDILSGLNEKSITLSISNGNKISNISNDVGFVPTGISSYQTGKYTIAKTLDGKKKSAKVGVYDNAGNYSSIDSDAYIVYQECTNKVADGSSTEKGKCSKSCGGGTYTEKTVYKYKDANTGKSCTSEESSKTLACNTQACQELSCPTVTVKGAVKGNGNWYKKGNSDTQIEIKPTSGTSYWSWATDGSDGKLKVWTNNNKGTQLKPLGDGKRKYQIVVYDSNGNSKKCDGDLWIDTKKPSVTINYIKVYQVDGSLSNIKEFNVKHRNGNGVPELKDIGGGVVSCFKKGQEHDNGGYICKKGSSYTAEDKDNLTPPSNLYLKYYENVISDSYCHHPNRGGCPEVNTPYPFPVKYTLCATDEAGNTECDAIRVAFQANCNNPKDVNYGTGYSNGNFSWTDNVWKNNNNERFLWEGYNR